MDVYAQVKKHLKLVPDNEITDICEPLFKNFGLNFFSYNKVYPDGSRFVLATNHNFINWIYDNKLTVANSFTICTEDMLIFPKSACNFLPKEQAQKNELQILGGRNYFNIDLIEQGCNIIKRPDNGHCEIFDFAGPVNSNNLIDFYTNNPDILNHFINYFKAKAAFLIKKLEKNRIIDISPSAQKKSTLNIEKLKYSKDAFYRATKLERFPIFNKHAKYYLTKQEINCLIYLIRGKTAKQVAKILNISPKTVESYIDSSKQKLNCESKADLIDKIIEVNLFNFDYLNWVISQDRY